MSTAANIKAFEDVWLRPYAGVFKNAQDLTTTVAGYKLDTPIYPSSVGGLKGVPLSFLSSGLGEIVDRNWGCWVLVEGTVAQHGI